MELKPPFTAPEDPSLLGMRTKPLSGENNKSMNTAEVHGGVKIHKIVPLTVRK